MTLVDHRLREWATERERQYLDAILKYKSVRRASSELGVSRASVQSALRNLQQRAVHKGFSPQHDWKHPVPEGFNVKRLSMHIDKDGSPANRWVIAEADKGLREEVVRAFIRELAEDVRGLAPLTPPPAHVDADLMSVYPMGDPHIGLQVWAAECGEAFDLQEARRLTLAAVDRLVQVSPASHTAVLLPLGDVFHQNDQTNATPAHRHQLDVAGRYAETLMVGVATFRHAIQRLLEKHQNVVVRFIKGNHDPDAVWALAVSIAGLFENEPRVKVDISPADHWFYQFGKVMLGSTHGDKTKPAQLPGVMAAYEPEMWGRTKHRYWYCGHVHKSGLVEYPGVTIETFRTIAAADSYATGHGYRAGRDMRCIVHHREDGEVERYRCDVGRLKH